MTAYCKLRKRLFLTQRDRQ